ncbi:electron transfer flavoprotein beta subunit lysine methyltransferase [Syngnathoides biaculeatus]|uniref:electron transfer flavoprotein beta subunit lysine methyltransferase n=1 Tax=Syngnathoides biaculeatus TaxID=300417 RepID=UPI002ADE2872|nr:electron transfer flavoprotein beta subunit lysine methyltransferase [Syngnathoides biaculeatus]
MSKGFSFLRLSYIKSLKLKVQGKCFSVECVSSESIRRFISENTEIVRDKNLTPEIKLRLFTPNCRFWFERPELWPFDDPYWAIYWPGGQALSRYLLDNPGICFGKSVLDLGSGCGASAIAAKLCGANRVVANDIDSVAMLATCMNSELNGLESPVCVTDNLIGSDPGKFDLILLGDMFYDEALSCNLHTWLEHCIKTHNSQVLIGDPGRAQFEEHGIQRVLQKLAQFKLPKPVREENYGLTCSSVWYYDQEQNFK